MPPAGFEPSNQATKTYALDRVATGTSKNSAVDSGVAVHVRSSGLIIVTETGHTVWTVTVPVYRLLCREKFARALFEKIQIQCVSGIRSHLCGGCLWEDNLRAD
jgi:hypothetical protein